MRLHEMAAIALPLSLLACACASAQPLDDDAMPQARTLDALEVKTARASRFPASTAHVDAEQADATTNALDVEDMAKYLPGVFVRKRNAGDTQPVLATRNWGVNSSARTLVFVDDVPISALVANNNSLGAPRWNVIAPEQVQRIDLLYGPYSARYSGNAVGGVMNIATKTPDAFAASVHQSFALQDFSQYGTHDDYLTRQTSLFAGDRVGRFAWTLAATRQVSDSQPLAYITAPAPPANTSGAFDARNKLGQPADVLGAGGLLHTRQTNANGMLRYDITDWLHATYRLGFWNDIGEAQVQPWLRDAQGTPVYAKAGGFASNQSMLDATHRMQALSLQTDTAGAFDGALVATRYDYLHDRQLTPASANADASVSANGRDADYAGTGWKTLDAQGTWRASAGNTLSFGMHGDAYTLDGKTRNTAAWRDASSADGIYSLGRGETRTDALWIEDAWRFAPQWLATFGARGERWQARDGENFANGVDVKQPRRAADALSPKFNLQWEFADGWNTHLSLAKAVRFPTVSELYQLVASGSTAISPDPNLKPETARSGEWSFERNDAASSLRATLFQETMRDALIAQTAFLQGASAPLSYTTNVGAVRNRGVELAARRENVLIDGLELSGSVTFVDSTILSNDNFASSSGTTSTGKPAPYVPRWRATATATWAPAPQWSFSASGRYSGRQTSTLDASDDTAHVFGAFDEFLVFDARVLHRFDAHWQAALGIDNLANQKYFVYHPFPQRSFVFELRWAM